MLNIRISLNSEQNNLFFIIYELSFHILMILSIILSYCIINSKNFNKINDKMINNKQRKLNELIDEEKMNNFSLIMKGLTKNSYKGKWKSIYDNGKY